jgi:hypothetical protein
VRKADLLLVAFSLATVVFAIAFVLPMFAETSVPWYYPLERRWAFEVKPTGLAMDFYGRMIHAALAATIAFVVAVAVGGRKKTAFQPRTLGLFTAWAMTATLLVIAYFAWTLYERRPVPAPIPDWYQPR